MIPIVATWTDTFMALLRYLLITASFLGAVAAKNDCWAQRFQPFGPLDFDHDLQIFAPPEISGYGNGPKPNTGYFFTYDRVHWNISRPVEAIQPTEVDSTWGNRFNLGYMTEDDHGWLMEILHADGPNNVVRQPDQVGQAPVPRGVANSMDFTSVEVMKQWRFKPLHHMSHVEVFAGFRYAHMMHEDNEMRIGFFPFTLNGLAIESHMFGPQIGLRWFKQKGRFTLSTEGRYYYAFNQQYFASASLVANGAEPFNRERWVQAGDLRVEVTYEVAKSFALAAGIEALYLANGVGRGFPPANDQDLAMFGWTFGMKFNR